MNLKASAGWNQTEADWLRLLDLAPEGCWGVEREGVLAATATAMGYGSDLAWIGMVLTLPAYRRQGLARILLEHALSDLLERGVRCIKLDATDMGRPLYEALGFRIESSVERWARQPGAMELASLFQTCDPALDRRAFGADRSALLRRLDAEGCLSGRPGSEALYFGPCVAESATDAEGMFRHFADRHPSETIYWDLLPENAQAVRLAEMHGFTPLRRLHRMSYKGVRVNCDNSKVFAIAGFEYG